MEGKIFEAFLLESIGNPAIRQIIIFSKLFYQFSHQGCISKSRYKQK